MQRKKLLDYQWFRLLGCAWCFLMFLILSGFWSYANLIAAIGYGVLYLSDWRPARK